MYWLVSWRNFQKAEKTERWVVKWSSRNDGFKDKKRMGRPTILNDAAKRILNKAKYKRGYSTRQLSQQLASKGHVGGKTPSGGLWKAKGWRPLRRQKKPLLTATQRAARLKFAKQYKNRTAEEWDDFLFSDERPRYLFQLPNPKNDIVVVLRRAKFLQHIWLKKFKMDHMGWNDRSRSHWDTFFTPRTDFDCRLLHQKHIRETIGAFPSP